ncbi:MAG TPA: hypothetical protein VFQ65_23400, partial [Kofleriaceae bacterium]|nr:hypothetical protein [Kofleriaceae bacterium]
MLVTVAVPGAYHYRVPARFAATARVGARVLVRFGGKQITGVIARTGTPPPPDLKKLLDISDVLDDEPALSPELVELCVWIASYYEAPPGEVIKGALPAGSGIKARRVLALTAAGEAMLEGALPPKPRALLGRLEGGPVPTAGMSTTLRKGFAPLIEQGWVAELDEREAARTRLKHERVVELAVPIEQARS